MTDLDLGRVADGLAWLSGSRLADSARAGLLAAGERVVRIIVDEEIPSRERPPVDRGDYVRAWRVEVSGDEVSVVNDDPKASSIEAGVPPGAIRATMALVRELEAWARRKGIAQASGAFHFARALALRIERGGLYQPGGLGIARAVFSSGRVEEVVAEELARAVSGAFDGW